MSHLSVFSRSCRSRTTQFFLVSDFRCIDRLYVYFSKRQPSISCFSSLAMTYLLTNEAGSTRPLSQPRAMNSLELAVKMIGRG